MHRIYIDLDGLLDTRLGTVASTNPEAAVQVIQSKAYWDREHTDWPTLTNGYLTNEEFEEAWEKRNHQTLEASVMTSLVVVLGRIIAEYHQNMKDGTTEEDIAVEVNVAPYSFNDEEMDELTEILRASTYHDLPVLFLSRPLDELTPEFVRGRYSAVLMFDFHRWIREHHLALVDHPCRHVTFVIPKLFEKNPERLNDEQRRDEFVAFRLGMLDHMELEFIDANWFSMYRPLDETQ